MCILDYFIHHWNQEEGVLVAHLQFQCTGTEEEVSAISHLRPSCETCLKQMSSSTNLLESF